MDLRFSLPGEQARRLNGIRREEEFLLP
jgi:hypothetical protein